VESDRGNTDHLLIPTPIDSTVDPSATITRRDTSLPIISCASDLAREIRDEAVHVNRWAILSALTPTLLSRALRQEKRVSVYRTSSLTEGYV
jgi:hypothetical protein